MENQASETIAHVLELVASAESKIAILRECVDASRARSAPKKPHTESEVCDQRDDSCPTETGVR